MADVDSSLAVKTKTLDQLWAIMKKLWVQLPNCQLVSAPKCTFQSVCGTNQNAPKYSIFWLVQNMKISCTGLYTRTENTSLQYGIENFTPPSILVNFSHITKTFLAGPNWGQG